MSIALPFTASIPPGRRIYAVGDVHGRHDLLEALHQRIEADQASDGCSATEIYLGDMVDRGPSSAEVMLCLLRRSIQRDVIMIAGNHELDMLRALDDQESFERWLPRGGLATVRSFGIDHNNGARLHAVWRERARALVMMFCQRLCPMHVVGDYVFVHAGIRPGTPLFLQNNTDLTLMREPFLNFEDSFGYVVVHGHTPVQSIDIRHNRINLDTGAYATGMLSCLVLEVDSARLLEG